MHMTYAHDTSPELKSSQFAHRFYSVLLCCEPEEGGDRLGYEKESMTMQDARVEYILDPLLQVGKSFMKTAATPR